VRLSISAPPCCPNLAAVGEFPHRSPPPRRRDTQSRSSSSSARIITRSVTYLGSASQRFTATASASSLILRLSTRARSAASARSSRRPTAGALPCLCDEPIDIVACHSREPGDRLNVGEPPGASGLNASNLTPFKQHAVATHPAPRRNNSIPELQLNPRIERLF